MIPISKKEANNMISNLVQIAPEIAELDINPLLALTNNLVAVDARIRIEK